jgi:Cdc6-like AAA superfamily ATPase
MDTDEDTSVADSKPKESTRTNSTRGSTRRPLGEEQLQSPNSTPVKAHRASSPPSSVYTPRSSLFSKNGSARSGKTASTELDADEDVQTPVVEKVSNRGVKRAAPAASHALKTTTPTKRTKIAHLSSAKTDTTSTSAASSPTKSPCVTVVAKRKAKAKASELQKNVKRNVQAARHPTQLAPSAAAYAEDEEEASRILAQLGNGSSSSSKHIAQLSPLTRAKYLLHVGSTPSFLPGREKEFTEILEKVENAVDEGTGQCLYISGVPGTGKTATVRQVMRTLEKKRAGEAARKGAGEGEVSKEFNFVEINGMKISDASQVYSILWNAIDGTNKRSGGGGGNGAGASEEDSAEEGLASSHRTISSKSALDKLRLHFDKFSKKSTSGKNSSKRKMTVLLLDEMDQLITVKQDVIYNLFNWPNTQNSKLLVIALANTMDLPQRALSAKVASRLGWQSVTFTPYTYQQLQQIVQARLGISTAAHQVPESVKALTAGCEDIFEERAIEFMAKKVGNVNGDARRMLDIARRAIEKVEQETPDSRTRNNKRPAAAVKVTIQHASAVISDMAQSGKAKHISALSMHTKLLLWSTIACIRKTGLLEVSFEDLHAHHVALCNNHRFGVASQSKSAAMAITTDSLLGPLATLCSLGLLVPAGSNFGSAHAGVYSRYLLGVREDEVRFALREDSDERFKSLT